MRKLALLAAIGSLAFLAYQSTAQAGGCSSGYGGYGYGCHNSFRPGFAPPVARFPGQSPVFLGANLPQNFNAQQLPVGGVAPGAPGPQGIPASPTPGLPGNVGAPAGQNLPNPGGAPIGNGPIGNGPVGNGPTGNSPVGNGPINNGPIGGPGGAVGSNATPSPLLAQSNPGQVAGGSNVTRAFNNGQGGIPNGGIAQGGPINNGNVTRNFAQAPGGGIAQGGPINNGNVTRNFAASVGGGNFGGQAGPINNGNVTRNFAAPGGNFNQGGSPNGGNVTRNFVNGGNQSAQPGRFNGGRR